MLGKFVAWLLSLPLSVRDRTAIVNAVIHRFDVPSRAIISVDENRRILVQGEPLSLEQSVALQEASVSLRNNSALKLIRNQVRFQAVDNGFLQSPDPETQLFYKAALWASQEEDKLIDYLAGPQHPTL